MEQREPNPCLWILSCCWKFTNLSWNNDIIYLILYSYTYVLRHFDILYLIYLEVHNMLLIYFTRFQSSALSAIDPWLSSDREALSNLFHACKSKLTMMMHIQAPIAMHRFWFNCALCVFRFVMNDLLHTDIKSNHPVVRSTSVPYACASAGPTSARVYIYINVVLSKCERIGHGHPWIPNDERALHTRRVVEGDARVLLLVRFGKRQTIVI